MTGFLERIFIAPAAGDSMRSLDSAQALVHAGLQSDRYASRKGHWSGSDQCQVTLIEGEHLDRLAAAGWTVLQGEHRRNLVTRGIRLRDLRGLRFRIGEAVLEYHRPRPPCDYVESVSRQPGLARALGAGAGICARVLHPGVLRVGDPIIILDPQDGPGVPPPPPA